MPTDLDRVRKALAARTAKAERPKSPARREAASRKAWAAGGRRHPRNRMAFGESGDRRTAPR